MRLYTFTHFQLSSIQQGIQASHAQSNLFLKYTKKNTKEFKALYEWAKSPTMICLNGGNSASLKDLVDQLDNLAAFLKLPYGDFREDENSMEGMRTAVAVIVPEPIYTAASVMRSGDLVAMAEKMPASLHQAEIDLASLLNRFHLAK